MWKCQKVWARVDEIRQEIAANAMWVVSGAASWCAKRFQSINPIIFHRFGQITDTTDSWQTHSGHFWTFLDISGHFWTFLDISGQILPKSFKIATNRDDEWRLVKPCDVASRCQDQYENFIQAHGTAHRQSAMCSFASALASACSMCSSYSPFIACFQNVFCMSPAFWANGFFKSPALSLSHVCLSENCLNCFNHKISTGSAVLTWHPLKLLARILWMHLDPWNMGFRWF